ncbi:universal stress protein [Bradyrhizobium canariense]|uniref:Universal stress protein family protein n=1 Tax=Bradyrhizobium canariense TaxID=255045 RepID=A0A1H1SXS4_9BRAD|nr:universal stress protein [Bradyrhizobium canariense]SDS52795.1 Universal stress protein family protein [Bradyrhizobium canariense]
MLKTLLVHIPSERSPGPVIDCAVSLTASLGAHLDAIAIGYEAVGTAGLVADGGAALVAMEFEYDRALERAEAAIAVCEAEATRANIAHASRILSAGPAEAAKTMGVIARLYDLTIVLQPDYSRPGFDDRVPQEVLFDSGGPMLMVPYIHKGPLNARNIGIAWDGSRLAARALRDAMPFLTEAATVTVIAVNENRDVAVDAGLAELAVQLTRRGIHIRIERLEADGPNIHDAILSTAADNDIGLLVMGGYGHSRLKERVLGGVTKGVFESMTVPTLMSH